MTNGHFVGFPNNQIFQLHEYTWRGHDAYVRSGSSEPLEKLFCKDCCCFVTVLRMSDYSADLGHLKPTQN